MQFPCLKSIINKIVNITTYDKLNASGLVSDWVPLFSFLFSKIIPAAKRENIKFRKTKARL